MPSQLERGTWRNSESHYQLLMWKSCQQVLVEYSSPSMHSVKFCHHWAFEVGDIATPSTTSTFVHSTPLLQVLRLWWDPAHAEVCERFPIDFTILFWRVLSICKKQRLPQFLLWCIIFLYSVLDSEKAFTRLLLFVISIKVS